MTLKTFVPLLIYGNRMMLVADGKAKWRVRNNKIPRKGGKGIDPLVRLAPSNELHSFQQTATLGNTKIAPVGRGLVKFTLIFW